MSSSTSAFSQEIIDKSKYVGDLQDSLFDLNVDNLESIKNFLQEKVFQIINESNISRFIHCLFTATEYRVLDVFLYCKLLQDIVHSLSQEINDIIKKHLLSTFRTTAGIVGPRCFFLRQCMLHDIISAHEIVISITSYYHSKPNNPERIIHTFCWFAPELEAHNPSLFNHVINSLKQSMDSGMIYPPHKNFMLFYDQFRQNNWELFKSITSYGFNPDMFSFILLRDDVEALKSSQYFDIEFRLQETIFDCSHILDTRPYLIQAAAFFGAVQCFKFLIEKGAHPEEIANKQKTLIDFAVAGGNLEILQIMKEKEMNFDSAIDTAVVFHRKNVVEWIMNNLHLHDDMTENMFLNAAVSNDINLILKCLELGVDINCSNSYGKTALLIAAQNCHSDVVDLLLQHPQIDANVGINMNALDWAISCDDTDSVRYLISCKRFVINPADKEENSIMYAISRGNVDVCRALLEGGVIDLNYKDEDNHSPLQYAVMYDSVDVVKLLIDQPGVNINEADVEGRTILHYAAASNFVEIIKILVGTPGININIKDKSNATPLTLAISWEQEEAARALREAGALESDMSRVVHTADCHNSCEHGHREQ